MEEILIVENIKKEYGRKGSKYEALKGISFKVSKGEFVGIMGSSGAGKSTLLNIISTIDLPSSGNVYIEDKNIIKMKQNKLADFRRDNLGFVFQDSNLLDTLTIKENIMLPLSLKNEKVSVIESRIKEVSKSLNIESILDKYPNEVSGGQKQRGAVCRAIVTKPSLILADEPTGALDSKSARDLLNSLLKLNRDNDSTILMVTHDAISASFCSRILFIKDGIIFTELIKGESTKEFYNKILNTVSLIGGVNKNEFI
ncbi:MULTISPECIES: ABC transporter ATP-binding protein [unclassified Clostridioides]|uniref:ABC transporter ATP-binding protein n=1 Tax=unclassified Clostridioides TaxID=2635829 RepID=UPI001D121D51|nr:ABC transporter ATP-binding protein [Clostridioides sp. ZZV14-6154]MCC0718699.1 ABC transporter ATP-binding protein [Clostridioides sp. ZZV14-6105]MCC0726292.1 ABC transporter ATP-binding protein [Clostridioides sp. ZZV14-6045]MCC0729488.1 ABC transporter ATP-binding protein [Clostridioides sp. ZZV14-6048]MCC0733762.1 ABC transporter ATP-binding protein [Clostridioides sp. ZZV14-6009]MCC0739819.1 ABC transporter ATP-binding protein [Clostridioides sp. ZZV14-5902]WLD27818.1 ABC transporter 